MKLEPLTKEQCELVRQWRNADLVGLRTPYMLTEHIQKDFYDNVICNRNSHHRYWAIIKEVDTKGIAKIAEWSGAGNTFVGMGGLTNIQWENRLAEISLIIDPTQQGKELGTKAVDLLLDQAFHYLNLTVLYGECYLCNEKALAFWKKIAGERRAITVILPNRKYWCGKYWDSFYFSIRKLTND